MAATAAEMVVLIQTALEEQPGGIVSWMVDGATVKFDRKQALQELRFWERKSSRSDGTRPLSMTIDLSGS